MGKQGMRSFIRLTAIIAFALSSSTLSAQTAAPTIAAGGILSAASLAADPGNVAAPGALITIFGQNLAPSSAVASSSPLPLTLNATAVQMGNQFVPLLFVSPTQINAQVPFEIPAGTVVDVTVWNSGQPSEPQFLRVAAAAPAIFTLSQNGSGNAVAFHLNGSLVTSSSLAGPGEEVSILMTGLGSTLTSSTAPPLVSGANGNGQPTLLVPTVTIGGGAALVTSSVAAPNQVGQYLVKVIVPADAPGGDQLVIVSIGGKTTAAPVSIPIAVSGQPSAGGGFVSTLPPPLFLKTTLEGSFTASFGLKIKTPLPAEAAKEVEEVAAFSKTINSPGCTVTVTGANGPTYEGLVHCQDYTDPTNLMAIIMTLRDGKFADNKLVFTKLQTSALNVFFFIGKGATPPPPGGTGTSVALTVAAPITSGALSIDFKRPDFAVGDTIIGTVHSTIQLATTGTIPGQTVAIGGGFMDTISSVTRP